MLPLETESELCGATQRLKTEAIEAGFFVDVIPGLQSLTMGICFQVMLGAGILAVIAPKPCYL